MTGTHPVDEASPSARLRDLATRSAWVGPGVFPLASRCFRPLSHPSVGTGSVTGARGCANRSTCRQLELAGLVRNAIAQHWTESLTNWLEPTSGVSPDPGSGCRPAYLPDSKWSILQTGGSVSISSASVAERSSRVVRTGPRPRPGRPWPWHWMRTSFAASTRAAGRALHAPRRRVRASCGRAR